MLKNQAFACAVPGWVLEGCGFDVAALLQQWIASELPVRTKPLARRTLPRV